VICKALGFEEVYIIDGGYFTDESYTIAIAKMNWVKNTAVYKVREGK